MSSKRSVVQTSGTVLVSPSVSTGYDFPGRECEWQFICKVPFPDGRAKIQQATASGRQRIRAIRCDANPSTVLWPRYEEQG